MNRNTVDSYESDPLSLGDLNKRKQKPGNIAEDNQLVKPKSSHSRHLQQSQQPVVQQVALEDGQLVKPKSSHSRHLQQSQQTAVQQVVLDKSSIEYLSTIIQERINREFASRDQQLLSQVNKLINSAINEYSRNNSQKSESLDSPPISIKMPQIEATPMEMRSLSGDDVHRSSRKSIQAKPDSKIPRIKLPKINNIESKQPSARNPKVNPTPSNQTDSRIPSARRGGNNSNKINFDDIQLDGVIYPQCRSAVSASNLDVECLKSLASDPLQYKIRPTHCFGYNGDTSKLNSIHSNNNIYWIGNNFLVYPSAALVVVLNLSMNRQAFFHGHTEQVTCLSINKSSNVIASCQSGSDTKVRIWDYTSQLQGKSSNTCSKLGISSAIKTIGGLNFSGDGKYLLVYASEDVRSIFVLDWTKNNVLCCVKSGHPDNCEVFFDPYSFLPFLEEDVSNLSPSQSYLPGCYNIISRSSRQLKVWTMKSCLATEPTKSILKNNKHMQAIEYVLESGSLHQGNKQVEYSSVICTSTHEASSYIFTGIMTGAIQIWVQIKEDAADEYGSTWIARGRLLMVIEKAHDSPITNFDFVINSSCCKVATCDKEGVVNIWNMNTSMEVSKEDLLAHADAVHIEDVGVRTLLWKEDGTQLLAGTMSNNILAMSWSKGPRASTVEGSSVQFDFLVRSHTGKIRKMALNPVRDNIFVTIGTDKMVKIWNAISRQFICHLNLEISPTAIQFTADGLGVAVGNEQGELIILRSSTFSSLVTNNSLASPRSIGDWEVVLSKEFTSASGKVVS